MLKRTTTKILRLYVKGASQCVSVQFCLHLISYMHRCASALIPWINKNAENILRGCHVQYWLTVRKILPWYKNRYVNLLIIGQSDIVLHHWFDVVLGRDATIKNINIFFIFSFSIIKLWPAPRKCMPWLRDWCCQYSWIDLPHIGEGWALLPCYFTNKAHVTMLFY